MVVRRCTAYLWRFVPFRIVIAWCAGNGIAVRFIAVNTPFLIGLKELWLREGNLPRAAEVQRVIDSFSAR